MSTVDEDLEKLNSALAAIGERAAADPAYREELQTNQVQALATAGVSVLALSGALKAEGADEEEVAAFGMDLMAAGGGDEPEPFIFSMACTGTCKGQTLWVCGGCNHSMGSSGPINPVCAAATMGGSGPINPVCAGSASRLINPQ